MPKMRIVFSWAHIISGAEPPPAQNPSYAANHKYNIYVFRFSHCNHQFSFHMVYLFRIDAYLYLTLSNPWFHVSVVIGY